MTSHSFFSGKKPARRLLSLSLALILNAPGILCAAQKLPDSALAQISALEDEKAAFSAAEKKMDSQLVFALKRSRKESIAKNAVPLLRVENNADANGMVEVDVSGSVTSNLLQRIQKCGGQLRDALHTSPLCVRMPMNQLESIAALPEVKFIAPAARMHPNVIDFEGVFLHDAVFSWSTFGVNGGGVKIGVLSDSVDFLAGAQASNDLGPVTVLPGQSGVPATGEGTALLEIVHAMAPGAQLFFATAKPTLAQFASNIVNLRLQYGCDIILDDLDIEEETPFQDGIISQAIATVTTNGALYLSAAGNEGNAASGVTGTWEGDFAGDGAASAPLQGKGQIHSFGYADSDSIVYQSPSPRRAELFWSDPWGASDNDYDLFVLDVSGSNVVASSVNVQNGSQNPFEAVPGPKVGESLVIVLASGAGRFLHLTTQGGVLSMGTAGATRGHNASTNALTIAAFSATAMIWDDSYNIEPFSSDGPRQMFYYADGTPITPGNVSSSGGAIFLKPDLAAADAVTTTIFNPFYGTSAAVANAAGVAALVKSFNPSLTPAEMESILDFNTQNSPPAWDPDQGYGYPLADYSIESTPAYEGAASIAFPPTSQQVALGAAFVLNVSALGAPPLTYQWQKNGANLTDTGELSGSATSSLTNAGTLLDDAGTYSVIVNNSLGSATNMGAVFAFAPIDIVTSLDGISNYANAYFYTEPGVVAGPDGNFYGAIPDGGIDGNGCIFVTTPGGMLTDLYDFGGTNDGGFPNALVLAEDGNFYGTAQQGGNGGENGTVFKVTPGGQLTSLYDFTNGVDGSYPVCGLTQGKNGVLFGTAFYGGTTGNGSIYEITTSGRFTTLYSFSNTVDGANPTAAPVLGQDGYLYGTTSGWGAQIPGTIYKLAPSGVLTTLYTFTGELDGGTPWAGLTPGSDGNYYGVTSTGGQADEFGTAGGTAFRITPAGNFKVLHSFSGATDGMMPVGKMALGHDGNFYGVTTGGGPFYVLAEEMGPGGVNIMEGMPVGNGSAFKMTPEGIITALYFFTGGADGYNPAADLTAATDGNIYGVDGNVFRITPNGFGPRIVLQPQDQTVVIGSNALFFVPADGAPPLSYQWQFEGANITGATNASLIITNVQKQQLGEYRATIRNPIGSVVSSSALLSFGTSAVITRQPQSQNLAAGARAAFTVAATGSPPLRYQWQVNGANIFGATTAALAISSVNYTNAGAYSVLVANPVNTTASSNALLSVFPPPPLITSPVAGFQSASNSVTVAGKTGSSGVTNILFQVGGGGWQTAVLSSNGGKWSAIAALAPGTNAFQAVAQTPLGTSLPASAALIFNPFISAAGVYDGLFLDATNISTQSAGSVALTVSSTRVFTGKITRAGGAESFTGKFDNTGTAQLFVSGAKLTPVGLSLLLDLDPGAYVVNGVVSNNGVFNAPFVAWRALSGSVASYPPKSTFAIFPSAATPGYSYGAASIAPGASLTVKTYLLDGTTFSANGPLLQNGLFPLFVPLYKGGGWLLSLVSVTSAGLAGSVDWLQANGVIHTNLSLTGPPYAPGAGAPVLALTNGGIELFGGNLPAALSEAIFISSKNTVTLGAGDIEGLTASLNAATGFFSGTFRHPATGKIVPFQGALLPAINSGFGYFVEGNQAGGVIIGNFPMAPPSP